MRPTLLLALLGAACATLTVSLSPELKAETLEDCDLPDGPAALQSAPPAAPRLEVSGLADTIEDGLQSWFDGHQSRRMHLQLDRPIYRPGDTVWFRAWDLSTPTLEADSGQGVRYELLDPRGSQLANKKVKSAKGLNTNAFALPASAPGGLYTLRATSMAGDQVERVFVVDHYEAPQLRKELEFAREAYGPGDTMRAVVSIEGTTSGPLVDKPIQAVVQIGGEQVARLDLRTDAEGSALVEIDLPANARGRGLLSILVDAGGVTESISRSIPLVQSDLELRFYPEGGALVEGLPGRVYFEALDAHGQPADASGYISDETGALVSRFESLHDGLGRFELIPRPGKQYRAVIEAPAGIARTYALPAAQLEGCTLRTFDDLDGESPALRAGVRCSSPQEVVVVGSQRETVLDAAMVRAGPNVTAVVHLGDGDSPLAHVQGVARVTALDAGLQPLAERVVYRNPGRDLQIEITPTREHYGPRDQVTLKVQTRDHRGEPVPASLALSVADDRALRHADDERGHMLSRLYLESEIPSPIDDPAWYYDAEEADAHRGLDLVMGTKGWRRFEWRQVFDGDDPSPALVKANTMPTYAAATTAREGRTWSADKKVWTEVIQPPAIVAKSSTRDMRAQLAAATQEQAVAHADVIAVAPVRNSVDLSSAAATEDPPRDAEPAIAEALTRASGATVTTTAATTGAGDAQERREEGKRRRTRDGKSRGDNLLDALQPDANAMAASQPQAQPQPQPAPEPDAPAAPPRAAQAPPVGAAAAGPMTVAMPHKTVALDPVQPQLKPKEPRPKAAEAAAPHYADNDADNDALFAHASGVEALGYVMKEERANADAADGVLAGLIGTKGVAVGGAGLGTRGVGVGGGGAGEGLMGDLGVAGFGGQRMGDVGGAQGYGRAAGGMGKRGYASGNAQAGESVVVGALDKSMVKAVVQRHMNAVQSCYLRARRARPDLAGQVDVQFIIGADGRVQRAQTQHSTVDDPGVERCVNSRFERMRFPAPKGGGVAVVRIPIAFSKGSGPKTRTVTRSREVWAPVRVFPQPDYSRAFNGPRNDLRDTILWAPDVTTGDDGQAELSFYLSDAITTFRATAEGIGAQMAGRGEATFASALPVSVAVRLPDALSTGDRLDLPVTVSSALSVATEVTVSAQLGGAHANTLTLTHPASQQLGIGAQGADTVTWSLQAGTQAGTVPLTVHAQTGALGDSLERELTVVPRGYPRSWSAAGELTATQQHQIRITDAVPGTLTASVTLHPSPLATLIDGLEGLVQMPGGCFEQTSSTNYPNVLVLQYLKAHNRSPRLQVNRERALGAGYAKLSGYQVTTGGFETWGSGPGKEALSAYGLRQFAAMRAVYDGVSSTIIARDIAFLRGQRDGDGGYSRSGESAHGYGAAPKDVLDTYITWSLLTVGETGLDEEVDQIEDLAEDSQDPYILALATSSLQLAGRSSAARDAAKALAKTQSADGSFPGAKSSIMRSGGMNLTVESTALATMALLQIGQHRGAADRAASWLISHRNGGGAWGATQATVLALEALTQVAKGSRATREAGKVAVRIDGALIGGVDYPAGQSQALHINGLAEALSEGGHTITLTQEDGEELPYTIDVRWRTPTPDESAKRALDLTTTLSSPEAALGETIRLDVHLDNLTEDVVPSPIARVGLPAGLEAQTWQLEELVDQGIVAFYETRPREVTLYWDGIATDERHTVSLDLTAALPGHFASPASSAWPYYDDTHKAWAEETEVEISR